jgi:hypothetical protein
VGTFKNKKKFYWEHFKKTFSSGNIQKHPLAAISRRK